MIDWKVELKAKFVVLMSWNIYVKLAKISCKKFNFDTLILIYLGLTEVKVFRNKLVQYCFNDNVNRNKKKWCATCR